MKKIVVHYMLTILVICLATSFSFSQENLIRGSVTTFDSIAIANAQVIVKSSGKIVRTDSLGNFTIRCKIPDVVKIKAKGFSSRRVKLDKKIRILLVNLILKPGSGNEELAIGYGHVKDKNKLSSVSSAHIRNSENLYFLNMRQLLSVKFPDLMVQDNGEVYIRGVKTFGSVGYNGALIVVDGVMGRSLDAVNPNDVKSISILKGADAAIYGNRGANGVVIIETKSGGEE